MASWSGVTDDIIKTWAQRDIETLKNEDESDICRLEAKYGFKRQDWGPESDQYLGKVALAAEKQRQSLLQKIRQEALDRKYLINSLRKYGSVQQHQQGAANKARQPEDQDFVKDHNHHNRCRKGKKVKEVDAVHQEVRVQFMARQGPLVYWDRLEESWETFQSFQDNSRRVDIKLNEKMSNRRRQLFDVIEL
nr:hypothetical protein BaRGS_015800 [Batillaria attramentaria]